MSVSPACGSGAGTGRDDRGSTRSGSSCAGGSGSASATAVASGVGAGSGSGSGRRLRRRRDRLERDGRDQVTGLLPGLRLALAVLGLEPEGDGGDVVLAARGVGRVDERAHGGVEIVVLGQRARDRRVVDEAAEAVRAEQDHVARARGRRPDVDVDLPVGPERPRDDRALRVLGRLLGRQRARAHPLGDQRMVVREAREHAAAPEVGARVADVGERDRASAHERGRDRRAHARGARIRGRALGHAPVREADRLDEALLVAALRAELAERLDGDPRGQLARERAAHAVGDGEERRLGVVRVLVLAPDASGVRCGGEGGDAHAYSS